MGSAVRSILRNPLYTGRVRWNVGGYVLERVAQMAKDMQMNLLERMHKTKMQATEQPHELMELDARIARMRKRMAAGDPDITSNELRAALDRAEYKRRELAYAKPADISEGAKLLTSCRTRQNSIAGR